MFTLSFQVVQYDYYKDETVQQSVNDALYAKGNKRGDLPAFDASLAAYSCAATGQYANVLAGEYDTGNCGIISNNYQGCLEGFYQVGQGGGGGGGGRGGGGRLM